jgi:hypothetical protein
LKFMRLSSVAIILVLLSVFVIFSCISQAQDGGHDDGDDRENSRDQGNMSAPKENPPKNPSQNQPENQAEREDSPTRPTEKPDEEKPPEKPDEEKPPEKPDEEKPPEKPDEEKPPEKPDEEKPPEKPDEEKPPEKPDEEKPPEKPSCRRQCDDCDDCDYWWLSLASWMNFDSWPNSWSNSDRWDISYYSSQITEAPGILVDESVSPQSVLPSIGDGQNVLRIVSIDGSINWGSIDMPQHQFARLIIVPSTSGQLNLEEMCPNGEIKYYYLGDVSAGNQYRLWKYSDSKGFHFFRYWIDDDYNYSDTIRINVN